MSVPYGSNKDKKHCYGKQSMPLLILHNMLLPHARMHAVWPQNDYYIW